jgi:hypothetical protein
VGIVDRQRSIEHAAEFQAAASRSLSFEAIR